MFARLEAWITCQADYIVTSSTPTADSIMKEFPQITGRLTALTDAIDTVLFMPLSKDLNLVEKLQLPADKKLIVYLGALTGYQGVDLLLDSLLKLSTKRDDFHALIMGYPEAEYVAKADNLGLTGRVTFTGRLSYADAPRYLSLGHIAVSPKLSVTEANGKLLNYMACGLPCVVFDNPVNRELLGDCGVYVEQLEAGAFAKSVGRLLDNPDKCKELSRRSRDHAEKNHSWNTRIMELEKAYNSIIYGQNVPTP
jgi:glycosyltransferase involved in cell wall biosynthesis